MVGSESVVLDERKVMKMSHTVVVEFPCAEGKGAQFLDALRAALPDTRGFEGCELVETYTHQDDPDKIVLWEKWAAKPNQEAYRQQGPRDVGLRILAGKQTLPPLLRLLLGIVDHGPP